MFKYAIISITFDYKKELLRYIEYIERKDDNMKLVFKDKECICRKCEKATPASAENIFFRYESIDFKCPHCNKVDEIYSYLCYDDFLDINAMVKGYEELTVSEIVNHKPTCLIIGNKVEKEQSREILKAVDESFYTDKSSESDNDFVWVKKRNEALNLQAEFPDDSIFARVRGILIRDYLKEHFSDYCPLPLKVMKTELSPRTSVINPESWINKDGCIEYYGNLRVRNILIADDIIFDLISLLNRFPYLRLCITIFDDNQLTFGIDVNQGIKIVKKEDCSKTIEKYSLNPNNTLSGISRTYDDMFTDAKIIKDPLSIDELADMIGI